MCAFLIIGTFLTPATTDIAANADFAIPEGALQVSSLDCGGHVVPWLLALPFLESTIATLGAPLFVACALVVVGVLACYVAFFIRFGVRRPDETVKAYWEAQEEEAEEPTEETEESREAEREPAGTSADGTSAGQSEATRQPEARR
jgi:PTS system galactitol-specific IIC component